MAINLKRLLALLLALALLAGSALAEALDPMDAPADEAPVPEMGEFALPGEPSQVKEQPSVEMPFEAAEQAPAETPIETGETPTEATEAEIAETPVEAVEPEVPEAPVEASEPEAAQAVPEAPVEPAEPFLEADADAQVAAPGGAPVLAVTSLAIGAKDKYALTLANGASPRAVGAVFTTSNKKIATVNEDGVLTAKKAGAATIVMDVGGVQSSCAVTVAPAPKKLALSAKKLTMGVGEMLALGATVTPADTITAIAFTSSNPGVAAVDAAGTVVATGVGTATVTASTYNGKKAKCKITVLAAPTYVTADVGALTLWLGRVFEVEPVLSPGSGGTVACVSSNGGVVVADGTTLHAVGMGSCVVSLITYNGLRADIPVTVTKAPVYRALLVGEGTFPDSGMSDLPGPKDVALMGRMLAGVKGPSGDPWQVQTAANLTAEQIHDAIRSAFAGAREGDVSLFYISTHGDEEYAIDGLYGSYAGCLLAYPDYRYDNWYNRYGLTLGRLAGWLCEVPGQVVVFIDSCGSGAAIYGAAGVSAPALSPEDFDGALEPDRVFDGGDFSPAAFDQAVVDAFSALDNGVLAAGTGAFVLENKFFVLTSSAYRETGWSVKNKYSYFTKWLTDAVKTKGKMPADANKNRFTTLNELYQSIRKKAEKKTFKYEGVKYKQHVQVYPAGSGFELFFR